MGRLKDYKKSKWSRDLVSLDIEEWDDIWDYPFQQLILTRNRLIQFKIVPCSYLTPAWLSKLSVKHSAAFWRCLSSPADFIHDFWSCFAITLYQIQILQYITDLIITMVPLDVRLCLLGLVEPLVKKQKGSGLCLAFCYFTLGKALSINEKLKPHLPQTDGKQ